MQKSQRQNDPPKPPEESPTAWFVVLEGAREAGDAELVQHAHNELTRLGVTVTFADRRAVDHAL